MVGSVKTTKFLIDMLNGHFVSTSNPPTHFNIGNGTTNPVETDTELENRLPVTSTIVDNFDATAGRSFGGDTSLSINTSIFKEGTGSLSIAKNGTSSSSAWEYKTTTSVDFTSKDFYIWIYIVDKTDLISSGTAVTIRFGSDTTNYYYYNINISNLSNGWNEITFNSSTATGTTGTPTITACDFTYIAYFTDNNSDLVAADRFLIDFAKVADNNNYKLNFTSGYPVINTSNFSAVTQGKLGTTDANGSLISEFGEKDTSENLQSHIVFDGESKSNTDIFIMKETTFIRNQS